MLQATPTAAGTGRAPANPDIQFYSVELTPLADGRVFVGVSATVCEGIDESDFELVAMQMASTRVGSLDEALSVIRNAISAH
jgi:hypothetical protein